MRPAPRRASAGRLIPYREAIPEALAKGVLKHVEAAIELEPQQLIAAAIQELDVQ
jgi:hypothetical protein